MQAQQPLLLAPHDWTDYALLDSGNGNKLERFGTYLMMRPDPRAIWSPGLGDDAWDAADAKYIRTDDQHGSWNIHNPPPDDWQISYEHMVFTLKPTEFKHVGVFPEQAVNWQWMGHLVNGKPLSILNLFAYTGGATIALSRAGAKVTHVDSVKSAITWAKENLSASGLADKPVRWIQDDAYKFVLREGKRGNTYDGIVMDPPKFGRGPKGELWKIETDLPRLLDACRTILSPNPTFLLLNAYTADMSPLVLHHLVNQTMKKHSGTSAFGELALRESHAGRLLPSGIFCRWSTRAPE